MRYILYFLYSIFILSCTSKDISNISDYYENGNKKVVVVKKNNQISSKIFYNVNGDMFKREEYYLGKLFGVWKSSQPSLDLKIEFFGNGNKRTEGRFVNGKLVGRRSFYTRDGYLDKEKYFSSGIKTGCWVQYEHNDSKSVKLIEDYGLIKDNGIWTELHSNGRIKKSAKYLNNRLNGTYVEYFHDGKTKLEGKYNNGKKDSEWVEYNTDGYIKKLKTILMVF